MEDAASPPQQFLEGYHIAERIGQGAFSTVFKAVHCQTNIPVAVKIIPKVKASSSYTRKELCLMKSFCHPLLVSLYGYYEDPDNIFLPMEYLPNGSLESIIKERGPLPESMCRHYFCQLIYALEYLHTTLNVVHRDVKCDNIMIDNNGNIRLIDFGLSGIYKKGGDEMRTSCGSPAYSAPEMLKGEAYSQNVDIWGAGVVLYEMAVGKLPFDESNLQRLSIKVLCFEPSYPPNLSTALIDLIRRLLDKDSSNRITLEEVKAHSWFTSYSESEPWKNLCNLFENWEIVRSEFIADNDIVQFLESKGIETAGVMNEVKYREFDSNAASYEIAKRALMLNKIERIQKNEVKLEFCPYLAKRRPCTRHVHSSKRLSLPPLHQSVSSAVGGAKEKPFGKPLPVWLSHKHSSSNNF